MTGALGSKADAAREATRTLERALETSRSHWNDATRQSFDQRHADAIVAAGRRVSEELTALAEELDAALAALR